MVGGRSRKARVAGGEEWSDLDSESKQGSVKKVDWLRRQSKEWQSEKEKKGNGGNKSAAKRRNGLGGNRQKTKAINKAEVLVKLSNYTT